ncbi:MAG: hypothetical protein HFI11_04820 [Lachnospiraceae bacterium]|jgi:hypothetical protein|nr:hypothetical protein [Lachnospiraceae bacterium]
MKVKIRRLIAVLCGVIMICNSGMGIVAHAQENVETLILCEYQKLIGNNVGHGIYDIPDNRDEKAATLTSCTIGISVDATGVQGSITTGSTVTASKIGVENIRVEKYVNGKWILVGTHDGGYTTNKLDYAMNVTTSSAQKGVQYRISCTHYAILNGVRHELFNVTNGVSY